MQKQDSGVIEAFSIEHHEWEEALTWGKLRS
jgi:hypothetical protein